MSERILEGVRFREIIDNSDLKIEGYWIGENGHVWSCWKKGRNAHITDSFRKKLTPYKATSGQNYVVSFRSGGEGGIGSKRQVGRLVLNAFEDVSKFRRGWIATYKNGNHSDNRLENLVPFDLFEFFTTKHLGHFVKKPLDELGLNIIRMILDGATQGNICSTLNCNHKVVYRIRRMINEATDTETAKELTVSL